MSVEQSVAQHYTHGSLERTILDALSAAGKDLDRLNPADLAPVDEFHIGGRQATIDFAEQLDARPGMRLLDIGSGLGGASRYFAQNHGCRVTGVDLTEEYVAVAEALARRVGLRASVSYEHGSALSLPFAPGAFDGAYMIHVGMNIEDKARLFAEVRRVLVPGGVFGIYDVMRDRDGALTYPVPWASSAETSFVATAAHYRRLLAAAGFEILKERSRRDFASAFFQRMRDQAAQSGPAPAGLHILMGVEAPRKIANMIGNLERGLIAPAEIVCRSI
jgi:ubiquinone/menaquinone biosynthesis C-methylase UbiE